MAGAATLYRYNQFTHASLAFPVTVDPLAITADGIGNIYFTTDRRAAWARVYELPGAATLGRCGNTSCDLQHGWGSPTSSLPRFPGERDAG